MKEKFLNHSLNAIKKYNPDINDIKIDEIRYGLEAFYLTFTKTVIIFLFAFILNIFQEMLVMLITFNILRTFGFGIHATKSWICLVSSATNFLLLPFISKIIIIPLSCQIILGIIAILLIYKYSPADTKKRPLVNEKKRNNCKFKCTISCIILTFIMISSNNNILSNLIMFGIYSEVVCILPLTYQMFNFSYNNYKTYNLVEE